MNNLFQSIILIAESLLKKEQFDELLAYVSDEKIERIGRFRSQRDAQNCLLGDIFLRSEICRLTGADNSCLRLELEKHGKPYLSNCPQIHFNLSHSGNYVALAIDDEPVGIDIERIRERTDIAKIAGRFFAPVEIEYIITAADNLRLKRFFEVWTKKEANIKREGKGLLKALPSFSVLNSDATDDSNLNKGGTELEQLYYHKVFENDEALCHICSTKAEPPAVRVIRIDELEIQQLTEHLNIRKGVT